MQAGDMVAGRFEIEVAAGSGGMGAIFRARDRQDGSLVALKLLHPGADVERFGREVRLLSELAHSGIVRYIAHGTASEGPYLVMEWLEGEDLARRLERGPLTADEGVGVVRRAAEALGAVHRRGIVHRDIKPSNLWLVDGDLERVMVLDFGIARTATTTPQTVAGAILGTPAYMAPEQVRGAAEVDARADVYSLGCVLFECIAGRTPFVAAHAIALLTKALLESAPRLSHVAHGVAGGLDEVVARTLAKEPAERPADGEQLARQLVGALARPAVTAPPRPSAVPSAARPATPSLTAGEQRVASVILLGAASGKDRTVTPEAWSHVTANARRAANAFAAHIDVMVGGSIVVLMEGRGAATDEARRAASCALALRDSTGVDTMALATGRAEHGLLLIGEAADRAAALLGHGASGIRIDGTTASLLGEDFDTHGGTLAGRREADRARTLLGKPTPTVGREMELGQLEGIHAACVDESRASAVLVTGAAGVGKSRVRHELLRRLRARGDKTEVWIARGDPVGAGSAFGLVSQLVRRAGGVPEGEPLDMQHAKLRRRVARHLAEKDVSRVTCFLAEMIGAPFDETGDLVLQNARHDPMVMFDQVRMAWEDFVGAECAAQPLVIVLEDLHWGDQPTVTLCDSALRLASDRPFLVLAFGREEVTERFPTLFRERGLVHIGLRELSPRAAERLIVAALGDEATPELVRRLTLRAGGNAFYLEELIRAAAEGRSETPETALLMVQSRLQSMEPEARKVLRAASIFGQRFWEAGVATLVGDDVHTGRWLRLLEERELVRRSRECQLAGQSELVFRHAIVQEAAHGMLTASDKTLGHGLAAAWLEQAGETDAAVLAEHWETAGERPRAIAMWQRAAEQALDGNDYVECVSRAERGVGCAAEGAVLGRLRAVQAEAHHWAGGSEAAVLHATEAALRLLPKRGEEWAQAATSFASAAVRTGRRAELIALAEEFERAIPTAGPIVCAAAAVMATSLLLAGQGDAAERLLDAIAASPWASDAKVEGHLQPTLATRALSEGRAAEFVERFAAAAVAHEHAGDRRRACVARVSVGYGLLELGVFAEAEEALRTSHTEGLRLGLLNIASTAKQNVGWALAHQGRLAEAAELERASAGEFETQGDRRMQGASLRYLASVLRDQGNLAEAEAEARRAVDLSAAAPPSRAHARAVLSSVLLRAGRAPEALEVAEDAMANLESHGSRSGSGEACVRLAHAEALHATGDLDGANYAIGRARERLLERAAKIHREDWKATFLGKIPEHLRTLDLARAWHGGR